MTKKIFKMNLLMITFSICISFSACSDTQKKPSKPTNTTDQINGTEGAGTLLSSTKKLRIVDGAETGNLVLAGNDTGDIYTLNITDIPVYIDGELEDRSVLEDGMMAEITFDGKIEESYPARFGKVHSVSVYSLGTAENPGGTMYDLCGLYLQVLNDLWEEDSGLNNDITYVNVNLTKEPYGLTEAEKSAIAWIFASEHQMTGLTLSRDELIAQGYLTEVEILDSSKKDSKLYEWKNGVDFSITGVEETAEITYAVPTAKFNAKKWRSPLGAYFFSDCEAVWPEIGTWSSYSVGAYMIS